MLKLKLYNLLKPTHGHLNLEFQIKTFKLQIKPLSGTIVFSKTLYFIQIFTWSCEPNILYKDAQTKTR